MKKIVITATAESYEQARELLELGVDRIYIGEKTFGLRLPKPLSFAEMRKIAELVHESGKELTVAVNALMHQSMMDALPDYLDFLEDIKADYITVGDAGVFYICNRDKRPFKMIYDASTMVTSSRQINFWGKQAGASEAVLAREIPSAELFIMAENLQIPAEVLVYGQVSFTTQNDHFFKTTTTLSKRMKLLPKNVTSFFLNLEIQILTTQSMKTCMEHISLPIMTWI